MTCQTPMTHSYVRTLNKTEEGPSLLEFTSGKSGKGQVIEDLLVQVKRLWASGVMRGIWGITRRMMRPNLQLQRWLWMLCGEWIEGI